MKTRIDIISGFLGAGKTTLILELLRNPPPGEKIAIVENEYGEVGIDGEVLKGREVEVMEVNAGCICCTLSGNLITGIKLLVAQHHPHRIILEPTGLASLADILSILRDDGIEKIASIGTPAAVLDGSVFTRIYEHYQRYFDAQLGSAAAVFVNRTEKLGDGEKIALFELLSGINPSARILAEPIDAESAWQALNEPYSPPETVWESLPKSWLMSFKQVAVDTGWNGSKERFEEFLRGEKPAGVLVRAKGYVFDGSGTRWRADFAGGAAAFEPAAEGGPDCLQIIGRNLAAGFIRKFFEHC